MGKAPEVSWLKKGVSIIKRLKFLEIFDKKYGIAENCFKLKKGNPEKG
jgi:hypothetical protein